MQPFHMESISAGDCAVLRVAGEIDVYTAPELRQRVIHLLDNGSLHIVADLCGVDFLDSTGLGALVGSLKRLRMRGIFQARDRRRPDPAGLPDHRAQPCLRAPLLGLGRHHRRPALAGNPRGTRRQDQRMVPEKRARMKPSRRAGRSCAAGDPVQDGAEPESGPGHRLARAVVTGRRIDPSGRQTPTEPVQ